MSARNPLNSTYTLMGAKLAVMDQKQDLGILVDSLLKMLPQYLDIFAKMGSTEIKTVKNEKLSEIIKKNNQFIPSLSCHVLSVSLPSDCFSGGR